MAREPIVGDDSNNWGTILNQYLSVAHNTDGTTLLDTTATNIKSNGNVSTGSTGIAVASDHVHPATGATLSDNGLLAATSSLDAMGAGAITTAGTVYINRMFIRSNITATTLWITISTSGSGSNNPSTSSLLGLYSSNGTTATLLSATVDMTTVSIVSGARAYNLVTPQSLTAGQVIYGAIVTNLATTQPTIRQYAGGAVAGVNLNLAAASLRSATNGTTQSTLPGTLTMSSNNAGSAATFWMGIS